MFEDRDVQFRNQQLSYPSNGYNSAYQYYRPSQPYSYNNPYMYSAPRYMYRQFNQQNSYMDGYQNNHRYAKPYNYYIPQATNTQNINSITGNNIPISKYTLEAQIVPIKQAVDDLKLLLDVKDVDQETVPEGGINRTGKSLTGVDKVNLSGVGSKSFEEPIKGLTSEGNLKMEDATTYVSERIEITTTETDSESSTAFAEDSTTEEGVTDMEALSTVAPELKEKAKKFLKVDQDSDILLENISFGARQLESTRTGKYRSDAGDSLPGNLQKPGKTAGGVSSAPVNAKLVNPFLKTASTESPHFTNEGIYINKLRIRKGGISIAGPNGVATAGSGGTAIVGPGGVAYTQPHGLAIAGPGAKVLALPAGADLIDIINKLSNDRSGSNSRYHVFPKEARLVATGPVVYYNNGD